MCRHWVTQYRYTSVCMYSIYVLHLPQTYLTLLLCSPSLSSLRYITAFLASSTPAYVQLGLKGKAELFCLWFVPAGVLSERRSGTPPPSDRASQAARRFMVNQNGGVIIVFGVRGQEELRCDSLITVLLAAACRHTQEREEGDEEETQKHTHTHTHRNLQYTVKSLLILSDSHSLSLFFYLPVSNTNHLKGSHCWDITRLYRGTTTILYDCAAISFIPDQFSTSVSFYSPIILFSHYLLWSPGKIRVTEEEEERLVAKREQSALQPDMCRSWALRHYQGFDLSGEASQFNMETSGCPSFLCFFSFKLNIALVLAGFTVSLRQQPWQISCSHWQSHQLMAQLIAFCASYLHIWKLHIISLVGVASASRCGTQLHLLSSLFKLSQCHICYVTDAYSVLSYSWI